MSNRTQEQIEKLDSKTKNYTEEEKKTVGYSYLKGVLTVVPEHINEDAELQHFNTKIENLIDSLPVKKDGEKVLYDTYLSDLQHLENEIKKKYNIISKGSYLSLGVLGMPVGMLFGLLFDNLVLGLLFGLAIGMAIGSALESEAKKENRLIH